MVDTPELFGGELRILAAIDFADGKIVRWVDYWDATTYPDNLYAQFRTPAETFPTDLKDGEVPTRADPELVDTCTALQQAFARSDSAAAHDLLHTDVVLVDMALRTQVIGRLETVAYLERVLDQVPYGRSSTLRHVVGGASGGGFEWTADDGVVGITGIERAGGLVTGITSVYDSRRLAPERKSAIDRRGLPGIGPGRPRGRPQGRLNAGADAEPRRRAASWLGGAPNWRRYSRLNCDGLS